MITLSSVLVYTYLQLQIYNVDAAINSYPIPIVLDSSTILTSYKEDYETSLLNSKLTEEDVESAFSELLYNPKINTREGIEEFSNLIHSLSDSLGDDPFPLYHTLHGGIYTREIHMPKGYAAVGKLHKHDSQVYMLKGKIIVADETGTRVVSGPTKFTSSGGLKRVGYILEDSVWIDIHSTTAKTIPEAEAEIFASSYEELDSFNSTIKELGYTEEEVKAISENVEDIVETKEPNIVIGNSNIHGKGIFAVKGINKEDFVCNMRIGEYRTSAGRYTNHSSMPNSYTKLLKDNNTAALFAMKHIEGGDEVTIDYKEAHNVARAMDKQINRYITEEYTL